MSGIVLAPKPRNPNEIRVCGDYRQANRAIKREKHQIPTVDEMIESMSGAVKYSKIDLKAGYHQMRTAPGPLLHLLPIGGCSAINDYRSVSTLQVRYFSMRLHLHFCTGCECECKYDFSSCVRLEQLIARLD